MKVPRNGSVYVDGIQYCDPTPVEMPLGYQVPESIHSMINRLCTDRVTQMELEKQNGGQDSEEEADDFEVNDGEELDFEKSGYQMTDLQEEYVDLKTLRADSETHAEAEVAQRVEEQRKTQEKQKVKRVRKSRVDPVEDDPEVEAQ